MLDDQRLAEIAAHYNALVKGWDGWLTTLIEDFPWLLENRREYHDLLDSASDDLRDLLDEVRRLKALAATVRRCPNCLREVIGGRTFRAIDPLRVHPTFGPGHELLHVEIDEEEATD